MWVAMIFLYSVHHAGDIDLLRLFIYSLVLNILLYE